MKIYLMTDMEGVAGILNSADWCVPAGRYYEKGKRLLTEEVNAAVDGFCAGGATEVLVVDGHGAGGIDPEILDERATFSDRAPRPAYPWLIDKSFAGIAFVGQHAKAGTDYSCITHTGSMEVIDYAVNGISIGEYGQISLCGWETGVPTFFAAGEEALCREAEALTPGVVTVGVKRGILCDGLDHLSREEYATAKLSAIHRAPLRARKLIREGAELAARKLKSSPSAFAYPELKAPFVRTVRRRHSKDGPAWQSRDEHPDSFIGLMNMPETKVED